MILNILGGAGAGKTTLKTALLNTGLFGGVVPFTTRCMRPGEVDGYDYNFISQDEFEKKNFFVTREDVGNWYGVSFESLEQQELPLVTTFNAHGVLRLKNARMDVRAVLLDIDEEIRLERMINRGDDPLEIVRRLRFEICVEKIINTPFITIVESEQSQQVEIVMKFLKLL